MRAPVLFSFMFVLLAAPAEAQRLEWTWQAQQIPYIQDPRELQMEIAIDGGAWQPLTSFQCGPVVPDVGFPLHCWWDSTFAPGYHDYLLRATRDGIQGWPFALVAPSRLSLQEPAQIPGSNPCPYTPPGGAPGFRPIGYEATGTLRWIDQPDVRKERLKAAGWRVTQTGPHTATGIPVELKCLGWW